MTCGLFTRATFTNFLWEDERDDRHDGDDRSVVEPMCKAYAKMGIVKGWKLKKKFFSHHMMYEINNLTSHGFGDVV